MTRAERMARFLSRVDRDGPVMRCELRACWVWTGGRLPRGYGSYRWPEERIYLAHRASWILHVGAIRRGLLVLHRCDNPSCVNPDHLYLGSAKDNTRDARDRGRLATGARHGLRRHPEAIARGQRQGSARLSETAVAEIRQLYDAHGETCSSLAERYGVSRATIERVANGKLWGHVPSARMRRGKPRRERLSDAQKEEICSAYERGGVTRGFLAGLYGVSKTRVGDLLQARGVYRGWARGLERDCEEGRALVTCARRDRSRAR
jgi:transposase